MGGAELDLRATPLTLRVSLTRGEDFVRIIEPLNPDGTPGAFPAGAGLILDFGDAGQWPATVTATEATWNVDRVTSDALMDVLDFGAPCTLRYRQGTVDRVWAQGTVSRHG